MGILLLQWEGAKEWIVPQEPGLPQLMHAGNFERFDGSDPRMSNLGPMGDAEGTHLMANPNRPGTGTAQPLSTQVYTQSSLNGLTNTLGGQPLPVANWLYRVGRGYTPQREPNIQFRLGQGDNFKGVAQTAFLADITNHPPVPDDMSAIISGWG